MHTIDFSRSYLRFRIDLSEQPAITLSHKPPTTVNNVRINVECRCDIEDRAAGGTTAYALGASCKTERVGGPGPLWLEPNADFQLVASRDDFLVIKSWQKCDMGVKRYPEHLGVQPERQAGRVKEAWTSFSIDWKPAEGRELKEIGQIIEATRGDRPLVSRTEYTDGPRRVVIDHPVKTINYSERENVFQTDTGPILLPDFSRLKAGQPQIEALELAFSAFNAPTWVEFIVNAPTPVAPGVNVNHYSKPRRIENVKNSIIEVQ